EAEIQQVEVLGDGTHLLTLDHTAIRSRLQPAGQRTSSGTIASAAQALLFLNIALPPGSQIPTQLTHRVDVHYSAAPAGQQDFHVTGGAIPADRRKAAKTEPPLSGNNYVSADSCCDATRHTRAALPVNGKVYLAQRYAVDWEQLDANNRIY